jgi:hypothetical protein
VRFISAGADSGVVSVAVSGVGSASFSSLDVNAFRLSLH